MKKLLVMLLILGSTTVFAQNRGWSQTGTVTEVYNLGWTVMVKLSGTPVSYGKCSSSAYYAIDTNDSTSFNLLYSQILMAHASGKNTKFWIRGDVCVGQEDRYQEIGSMQTW